MRTLRTLAAAALFAAASLFFGPAAEAAAPPEVYSVIEGRDTSTDRPVLVLVGKSLTKIKSYEITDPAGLLGVALPDLLLRSKTMIVLGLESDLPAGEYDLNCTHAAGVGIFRVKIGNGTPLPGAVTDASLSESLRGELSDASSLTAGTLSIDRYSAHDDLLAEGKVGTAADQVAAGDHDHAAAYSALSHNHDSRYFTEAELVKPGTVNDAGNPVDWTRLKGVPAGLADGVDDDTAYTAGTGIKIAGGQISVLLAGDGVATTAARSDHDHGTLYSPSAHTHDTRYYTETELNSTGTINAAANPVDWTRLKGVPTGLADGTDDNAWTEASGNAYRATGSVGIGNSDPKANLHVKGGPGVIFQEGSATAHSFSGIGNRFMYWADRGAITAGFEDTGNKWVSANVGRQSVAIGEGVVASGIASVALGWSTTATGDGSVALGTGGFSSGSISTTLGQSCNATGDYSTALGYGTTAQAYGSLALGRHNIASGSKTTWVDTDPLVVVGNGAFGVGGLPSNALVLKKNGDLSVSGAALFTGVANTGTIPATGSGIRMMWYPGKYAFRAGSAQGAFWDDANIGYGSVALCENTTASADAAAALGWGTKASGSSAMACNFKTTASGVSATALGNETTAQAFSSVAMGQFNVVAGTAGSWVSTEPVLVVGNGTSTSSRSNAFTLLKNGNLTIAGTLTQNSDMRLKTDIVPLKGVLARLAGVRGVSYRLRDETKGPAGRHLGLIAQEVRAAFPELVQEDSEGTLSVAYANLSAVLVEAVKEQQALLDAREKEIEALRKEAAESRASLEARLAKLEALLAK